MISSKEQQKSETDSTNTLNDLTYRQWIEKYKPHINPNDTSDYVFQPIEVDMKIVHAYNTTQVWTLISKSVDVDIIVPGKLNAARMGYYVTEIPWGKEEKDLEVYVDLFADKRSLINLYKEAFDAEKENVFQNFHIDVDGYDDLELLIEHLSIYPTRMNSILLALKTHEIPLYMMFV